MTSPVLAFSRSRVLAFSRSRVLAFSRSRVLAYLIVVCALASTGRGQISIGPQVRIDNGNSGSGVEPTVAFVRDVSTSEALAAGIDWREGYPRVSFGVTFNGGVSWDEGMLRPVADPWDPDYAVDPHAWADSITGDIWLLATGGEYGESLNRLLALVRAQGVDAAHMPAAGLLTNGDAAEHRPIMAAGPSPGNPNERSLYILWSRVLDSFTVQCQPPFPSPVNFFCSSAHLALLRSQDGGSTWSSPIQVRPSVDPPCVLTPYPGFCEFQGIPSGLIIADRDPRLGLVIAMAQFYAVWSEDGGATWPTMAERMYFVNSQQYPLETDIAGPFRFPFHSDADLDPATGEFYIVASARSQVGSQNLDLFIVRGRTTSGNPPIEFDPPVRLQLDPPSPPQDGPDQFMPSIAIDGLGGINLLYYDTQNNHVPDSSGSAFLDAYYTRISGFATPQQVVFTQRLTTPTFCTDCVDCDPVWNCDYEDPLLDQFIGGYNTVDASGCDVYLAYMTTQSGDRHYYVRHVDLCPPDSDDNLVVNQMDIVTFQSLFAAGDPRADHNRDGVVGAADASVFAASYSMFVP